MEKNTNICCHINCIKSQMHVHIQFFQKYLLNINIMVIKRKLHFLL